MPRSRPRAATLMRIGELAETTGVSIQTIHYYLREGLLRPPTKTAPNMAYYGPEYVEEIRLIKDLQERQFLPLAVIKLVLDARRQGKDISQLRDMRLSLEELFTPQGGEEGPEAVSLAELLVMSGLPAETLEALGGLGLLTPDPTGEGMRYDALDVQVAREVKKLLDLGLEVADLECYRRLVEAVRMETRIVKERVLADPAKKVKAGITGLDLKGILDSLKGALIAKVYRQAVIEIGRAKARDRG